MELQKLLFPKPEICMAETLYYHRNHRCELDAPNSILNFRKDGIARFDTYFNGFSIGKWKKYTILGTLELEIELKGRFIVTLLNNEMINGAVVTRVIQEETITSENRKNWRFSFAGFNQKGIHSFILLAIEDGSQFFGGRYFTDDVSPEELPDVKLALNMCTFRKEKYIYRNVAQIRRELIDNEQSWLVQLSTLRSRTLLVAWEDSHGGLSIFWMTVNAWGSPTRLCWMTTSLSTQRCCAVHMSFSV